MSRHAANRLVAGIRLVVVGMLLAACGTTPTPTAGPAPGVTPAAAGGASLPTLIATVPATAPATSPLATGSPTSAGSSPGTPAVTGTAASLARTTGTAAARAQGTPAASQAVTTRTSDPTRITGPAQRLRFGTVNSAANPPVYTYAQAMARVVSSSGAGVELIPVETGAAVDNINRISRGDLDLGIVSLDTAYRAVNGVPPWEAEPVVELRWLWTYLTQPVLVLGRADTGASIAALDDLDGKPFFPGARGSPAEAAVRLALTANGILPEWEGGSAEEAAAAYREGRLRALARAAQSRSAPDPAVTELIGAQPTGIIPWTEAQLAAAARRYPWLASIAVPAGTYRGTVGSGPVRTVGLIGGVAATTKLSDSAAYAIVKAIVEDSRPGGAAVQWTAFPAIRNEDLAAQTVTGLNVPLHPGATRYYRELGLTIDPQSLPPR
ncbi:MAG: TAXI family TRAP transporter solute-binding subunit [Chloroflexi bacterium]|nr:TAXI family TRAP transporter solute-binding subunit [Chloroflexota bacterium]